ncbi:MAG: phosphate acetyltransferase [Spirochaetes bacterium]|nr:MAG: phosphate acetyltransferase [Spirochaetota bacterium]RKX95668.1 MAG: phosphate acetyltransferase [Spirochaetota bacterium]
MTFTEKMTEKARNMGKTLVLPEGTEPRTLKAARIVTDEKIAKMVTLVGDTDAVAKAAAEAGISLNGITVVNPSESPKLDVYAAEYHELRKHKGLSLEDARKRITDPLLWGAMMVKLNDADAMVAGAENATSKVLIAGFTIVKTAPGVKSASSCFVMDFPDKKWGKDGLMIFSDCATIPEPTVAQLAEITLASAASCRTFLQVDPAVAMLSFSTKGSASHPLVDKVVDALKIVKEKAPDLNVDGEMQLDTAVIPAIGEKKAPGSPVAGKANTLIFPDLQAGNIAYKMAQRFAGAGAYGPFLQGFAKPISDLSRGASIDDIVKTCAVTLTQAE